MMRCPKCQASLPDGAGFCQFCKAQWAAPPTARSGGAGRSVSGTGSGSWVWKAYYAIAAWWVFNGVQEILSATVFATEKHPNGGPIAIVMGTLTALVGLGLILKVDVVRSIVNFLCFVNILFGLFGIVILFFLAPIGGIWGAFLILKGFLNIGLAGLMIYVIGETETRAPNF